MIFNQLIGGKKLPDLTNPGSESDLLENKQLIDQDGNIITGTIPTKQNDDIVIVGPEITIPSGYYSTESKKSVQVVQQSTPSISINSNGLISATNTQKSGYVNGATTTANKQLSTQGGSTITPSVIQKTAITAGKYTTGPIYVAGSSNLIASNIKSGVNIFGVTGNYSGIGDVRISFVDSGTGGGSGYAYLTMPIQGFTSVDEIVCFAIISRDESFLDGAITGAFWSSTEQIANLYNQPGIYSFGIEFWGGELLALKFNPSIAPARPSTNSYVMATIFK